ncbi:MAG: hypothetical protein RLZZ436_1162 [Planctomycetota bacterium]
MYLQDVRIDDIAGLNVAAAQGLSRGLTVLAGSSSAKLNRWLEGLGVLLRSLQSAEERGRPAVLPLHAAVRSGTAVSGELNVFSKARQHLLRQHPGAAVELLRGELPESADGGLQAGALIPRWLHAEDLAGFCAVEAVESAELQMLARLVMTAESTCGSVRELERARTALAQVLIDRDGNGLEGGVVHRISELRRTQGELQRRISALRDTGAETRKRTTELRRQLAICETRLTELAQQAAAVESERQQLVGAERANVPVAAEHPSEMLQRWRQMRATAAEDLDSLRSLGGTCLLLNSQSLSTMRESILRMEDRFRRLSEAGYAGGLNENDMGLAGASLQQVRQEVASLNHRLADYEQQLARQQQGGPLQTTIEQAIAAFDAVLAELQTSQLQTEPPADGSEAASLEQQRQQLALLHNQLREESQQLQLRQNELTVALQSAAPVVLSARALEQLDQLQAEYGELDTEVQRLEQQRRQLDAAERRLREAIDQLAVSRGISVLAMAGTLLQRLSSGAYRSLRLEGHDFVVVTEVSSAAAAVRLAELPQQQRMVVCLALRLALLRIQGAAEGMVPLLLSDELLRSEASVVHALVDVLKESAEQGQQVLWLIEDALLSSLPAAETLEIRRFSPIQEVRELPAQPPRLVLHTVEPADSPEAVAAAPAVAESIPAAPAPAPETPVPSDTLQRNGANWLFYLEPGHGVEDLAGISLGELEALRAARFMRVADLLERTVPEMEEAMRMRGFIVPVERLQALRGQAELATRVPMLRRGDAALLFAAGITSADELRKLRPEAVYEKVTAFQRSDTGARWRRSGRLIDRQQALNWARFGQFSRSAEELRAAQALTLQAAASSAVPPRSSAAVTAPAAPAALASADESSRQESEEATGSRVIVTRRRKQIPSEPASAARRARRVARREQLAAQLKVDPQPTAAGEGQPVERVGGMRFFLSRTSDVVQAPSIGPKTAEILHDAGVRTIEELLNIPAERIAEKLNQKRLTAQIIHRWQVQAQLVCRIPELRGHDAQILAACGISSPESLASCTPAELLAAMKPFLESAEGRRVLRNQNGPDLQEVTEWIQWAANARPLRAA